MIYIDSSERSPIILFKQYLYQYMKSRGLKYSQQREEVLKMLHRLSKPVTAQGLMELVNQEGYSVVSYTTTVRHINFYREVGWITVVNKVHKQYILVKDTFPIR